jgi:hypothetical protein
MAVHADHVRPLEPQSGTPRKAATQRPHSTAFTRAGGRAQGLGETAKLLNARPPVAATRTLAERLSAVKRGLWLGGAAAASPAPLDTSSHGPVHAGPAVVMRRVDPDFDTFRGATAGAATNAEMKGFYDRFVAAEVARFSNRTIDDDVKEAMKHANLMFILFLGNSPDPAAVHAKLNALIAAVNLAANNWDAQLNARGTAAGEASHRRERERRMEAVHHAGVTKEMPLRGVDSRTEAQVLLTTLQTTLNGALGGGFTLGHVGIRGSAVTGIRSRNRQPFEQATGPYQDVSDASDLDFFFTCPELEKKIRATEHLLPEGRGLNQGGTMNAQYLARWLALAKNGYANAAQLATALTGFSSTATSQVGRKCDVTFIGNPTAAQLTTDAGTLIL